MILGNSLNVENDSINQIPEQLKFIYAVILGPLIETAIFQYFAIILILKLTLQTNLINKVQRKHIIILIGLSSFLFALTHNYNFWYTFFAFIMGVYFGWVAVLSEILRLKKINVFLSVGLLHILINLIAYVTSS